MNFSSFLTLSAGMFVLITPVWADAPALPGIGFVPSRYEVLWTKSPFAVATPEAAPESTDYTLVGVAQFDGVTYVNLIDKSNQEHILVSTEKPNKGLVVISVMRGYAMAGTVATLQKGDQTFTLKLEQSTPLVAAVVNANPMPVYRNIRHAPVREQQSPLELPAGVQ